MGTKKKTTSKAKSKGGGIVGAARKVAGAITGKGGKGGGKRRHGVTYWQNKVLIEKLKKRYGRLKYGSVR